MNRYIANLLFGLLGLFIFTGSVNAQSAVHIYKNPQTGQGDFMFMYGMPSKDEAEFLSQGKLVELGYEDELIRKQNSARSKGYGLIIKSIVENKYGRKITVYGAAVGCKTREQAEREALENLRQFNPEWDNEPHTVVQRFIDR